MIAVEYLAASGLASASVVSALLMASRDFPQRAHLRVVAFATAAAVAAASPIVAWRLAGFARPVSESELPQEFDLLAVYDEGRRVSIWVSVGDEPIAYSFLPSKSGHRAMSDAGRELPKGGRVHVVRGKGHKADSVDETEDTEDSDTAWRVVKAKEIRKSESSE